MCWSKQRRREQQLWHVHIYDGAVRRRVHTHLFEYFGGEFPGRSLGAEMAIGQREPIIKTIRIANWFFLAVSLCLALAVPVLGIVSTTLNWQGICYGFTDGQAPCSWWEFAQNEMFWAAFLFAPLLVLVLAAWLTVNIIHWAVRAYRRANSPETIKKASACNFFARAYPK
jgi:hypothetical protein